MYQKTSLQHNINVTTSQLQLLKQELSLAHNQQKENFDPSLPVFTSFLERQLAVMGQSALRALYDETKAYQ